MAEERPHHAFRTSSEGGATERRKLSSGVQKPSRTKRAKNKPYGYTVRLDIKMVFPLGEGRNWTFSKNFTSARGRDASLDYLLAHSYWSKYPVLTKEIWGPDLPTTPFPPEDSPAEGKEAA